MASRSPLAQWLMDQLDARGEKPEQFAIRIGVNPSGFHKLMRGEYKEVRSSTLEKIATGLNMSSVDILAAVGKQPPGGDVERDLQARGEWFVSMLRGIPRPFWGSVIAATTAVAKALPSDTPISESSRVPIRDGTPDANGNTPQEPPALPERNRERRQRVAWAVTGLTRVTVPVSV